jgi:hypothetical protein
MKQQVDNDPQRDTSVEMDILLTVPYVPYISLDPQVLCFDGPSLALALANDLQDFWQKRKAKYDVDLRESRSIVVRKRDAKTPTWDGCEPAIIVEPAIWYFDPDTPTERMGFMWWSASVNERVSIGIEAQTPRARRNLTDFLVEDRERLNARSSRFGIWNAYLYR